MLEAVRNAFRLPDLRQKLLYTFLILVAYRLAAHIPLPGVNREVLDQIFRSTDQNILLSLLNFFSGGALAQFSVMAMGVYPYITATIIMQLLTPIVPQLEELSREGEQGRQQLNRYTHYMTVPLALLQAFGQATLLSRPVGGATTGAVLENWGFTGEALLPSLTILISLTAGTMLAMWMGELLTEQGIGNGVSLIIFAGIVAAAPSQVRLLTQQGITQLLIFSVITVLTVALIVWVQEGQRRIPVQYGKRVRTMRGNRLMMVGGQSTYVPMRVNTAGMIPLIFAQSLLILPNTMASYFILRDDWLGSIANFFFTSFSPQNFLFRQQNLPDTLQKQGGFIPGIRPGPRTEQYLNGVLGRITLVGALFLGLVAVLPFLAGVVFGGGVGSFNTLIISSTGLLIVVGVVLDTMKQIEAQLMMRNYEGFIR
ncbi:MAG: preprotein translocase subunit SecY [Caldilineaceae bacterium]|nr:preprotein translocase subunit SecY [Caldilineaceae bacterium]